MNRTRALRRLRWIGLGMLLLIAVGFLLWALIIPDPMPQALVALASDDQVEVETDPWLSFAPVGQEPRVGLILYPGGRVDPRAYAPAARTIAAAGYRVLVVPMPLNLAVLAPSRADSVIAAYPAVERWALGGHSLGGAMAARYAHRHPDAVQGLVLWGAYPASGDDLSERHLAVASIYGTRDGLAPPEEIAASRPLLPETTTWVAIEGGNHAQFGWYGDQAGDNVATISRQRQQEQVVAATIALLERLEEGP